MSYLWSNVYMLYELQTSSFSKHGHDSLTIIQEAQVEHKYRQTNKKCLWILIWKTQTR